MIEPIDNSPPVAGIDMILVDEYAVRARRPIRQAHPAQRPASRMVLFLQCLVIAALMALALILAAERTRYPTGSAPTAEPAAAAALEAPGTVVGIAAYAAPSHGSRYLAIPEGPGVRVKVCAVASPHLCVTRTSTDAGPDLSMQRAGRVADLSFADFGSLCRCDPRDEGTMDVRITYLGRPTATPPATDVGP